MRIPTLIVLYLLANMTSSSVHAATPTLRVAKDGFPAGHASPEGAACDLARAFIQRDVHLFNATCVDLRRSKDYAAFVEYVVKSMREEDKKKTPSPIRPKQIAKVFAARNLTLAGPASYGYSVFDFRDVRFVDIGVILQNGRRVVNRTLVIQDSAGSWYVDPCPSASPLLSAGLNTESASRKDFHAADMVQSLAGDGTDNGRNKRQKSGSTR